MIAQKTEEWLLQRLGCVTGSRFGDVCGMQKSGKGYYGLRVHEAIP